MGFLKGQGNLEKRPGRFKMAVKGFKIFHKDGSKPTKKGDGCPCAVLCKIGDLGGSGRHGNMRDTHSIKWPHARFGPPLFNATAPGKWSPG